VERDSKSCEANNLIYFQILNLVIEFLNTRQTWSRVEKLYGEVVGFKISVELNLLKLPSKTDQRCDPILMG
jgi:hypothetical protein